MSHLCNIWMFTVKKISTWRTSLSFNEQIVFICEYAHADSMYLSTTKFHKILLSNFTGVVLKNCFNSIFNFGLISKFKRGITPRKKRWIRISCEYANLHIMSQLQSFKNSVERFQRSSADKKTGLMDWLTDCRRVKIINGIPPKLGARCIIILCNSMTRLDLWMWLNSSIQFTFWNN